MLTQDLIKAVRGGYEVIPGIDDLIARELAMKFTDFAAAADVSTGVLRSIRKGEKTTIPIFSAVWQTLGRLYADKYSAPLQAGEKMPAEASFSDFETVRQSSKYKSRREMANVLGLRESAIEWIEKGWPISQNEAERILAILG